MLITARRPSDILARPLLYWGVHEREKLKENNDDYQHPHSPDDWPSGCHGSAGGRSVGQSNNAQCPHGTLEDRDVGRGTRICQSLPSSLPIAGGIGVSREDIASD